MAKRQVALIMDNMLYIGITQLCSIAGVLGFSDLAEPHKVTSMVELGMPVSPNGKDRMFCLQECLGWYMQNRLSIEELRALKIQSEIEHKQSQTQKIKLDYKIARGEYISVKEVGQAQAELIAFLKNEDKECAKSVKEPKLKALLDNHFKEKWLLTQDKFAKMMKQELE